MERLCMAIVAAQSDIQYVISNIIYRYLLYVSFD